jgi:hypothetical protein
LLNIKKLTTQELSNLVVERLAVLGSRLHDYIVEGVDECCKEYNQLLCDIWKLKLIFDTLNNPLSDLDASDFEYWTNVVPSIGGMEDSDFVVSNDLYLSIYQYYNNYNSGNGGGGDDDCVCFEPVNLTGRNFSTPTLFNQVHVYNDINEFVKAFLAPAQPPTITVSGQYKLNNSASYTNFGLVQRGTIVRDVKITVSGSKGANGNNIVETSTSLPSPTPASPTAQTPAISVTQEYTSLINNPGVTVWALSDQSNKTFSGSVKDSGNLTTTANVSYSFADLVYYGAAPVPGGGITEAFVKSLSSYLDADQFTTSLGVTTGSNQHVWFAYKDSLGDAVFTDLAINISGGFTRVNGNTLLPNGETVLMAGSTVTLIFDNGYTAAYRIYVTDNSNLGLLNFKVTAS